MISMLSLACHAAALGAVQIRRFCYCHWENNIFQFTDKAFWTLSLEGHRVPLLHRAQKTLSMLALSPSLQGMPHVTLSL
jgi:hypothetical protein